MNEVGKSSEVLKNLTAATVENAYREAAYLGRTLTENFLNIKRLVQDQSTYKMQINIFTAFVAELLFPDSIVMELEELIEWRDD
jgi:hypothetical protein